MGLGNTRLAGQLLTAQLGNSVLNAAVELREIY